MLTAISVSSFGARVSEYCERANKNDVAVGVVLRPHRYFGALVPLARAKVLAEHYLEADPTFRPSYVSVGDVTRRTSWLAQTDLRKHKIVIIQRHKKVIGAWISEEALSDLWDLMEGWLDSCAVHRYG